MTDLPIETQVALLQNEVHSISSVFTRLDAAIERIGELSSNISKMLAVHEEKLLQQNNINTDLYQTIETRRNELETDIKELHSRVTTQTREIVEKMDDMQTRLEHRMNAQSEMSKQQHDEMKNELQKDVKEIADRVDVLERWRWMIVGGAVVLGYILGHLEFFTKLFGK